MARPPTTPITIPAIAPPDGPLLATTSADPWVGDDTVADNAEELFVVDCELVVANCEVEVVECEVEVVDWFDVDCEVDVDEPEVALVATTVSNGQNVTV